MGMQTAVFLNWPKCFEDWVCARASMAVASKEAGAHYDQRRPQHERLSDLVQELRIIRQTRRPNIVLTCRAVLNPER